MKNKKAQASTFLPYLLIGIVVLLIFAIIVIPVAHVGDEVFDELKESDNFGKSNKSAEKITQVQSLITPVFDQLVFVILIAIMIGSLIIAVFTDYHPIVVGVFIVALIFLVLIGGLFANVYDEVSSTDELQDKAEEFTYTNAIMGKQFPIIIGFIGIIAIIILLAKRGSVVSPA